MPDKKTRHVIDDLRGGRNGTDPPWAIKDTECADAVNVDFYHSRFGNKRGGMAAMGTSSMTMTGVISSLYRHVPGTDETVAELWASDDSATPIVNRLAGSTTWAAPTLKDAPTGNGQDFSYASINGLLAIAYKSAQDRLHFWDGSTVRRGGLATPAAPTVADTGSASTLAVDATASLNYASGSTFTHTCGGSATLLFVMVRADSATVSSVTYDGAAMTQIAVLTNGGNYYLFYKASPSTGAKTVSITSASSVGAVSVSYTGTATSSLPDASATNTAAGAGTLTTTVTTVADRCWAIYGVGDRSGANPTAGTNSTSRVSASAATSMTLFDSNGVITPAGSFAMAATVGATSNGIVASFPGTNAAYSAVLRYYRVRWTVQSSGITIRRSEPSTTASFTPSGSGTAARITQPTVANEGETHWEIEASTDSFSFYRIATVAIGTTTYDDSSATTSYASNTLSALTGTYQVQKAYKYVAADQGRLLGFGSYVSTDKQNDVEVSAVIGSLDVGDCERVDTASTNYRIGLDENDSGVPTGFWGPVFGSFFAFKDRAFYQLTPTGQSGQPYSVQALSKSIGAIRHQAICRGDDVIGNAALYWMSHRGPYRWTIAGLEYIGRGIEDLILGPTSTINLAASKVASCVGYFQDKRQVWFAWATGSSNDPLQLAIFDVSTGGWSRVPSTDKLANIRCMTMFSNTVGASMSRDLKPYVGYTGASHAIYKCDTGTDDGGTAFQSYLITKAFEPGGNGFVGEVGDAILLAKAATGVTITDTIVADFGLQTVTTTAKLDPTTAGESRVTVPLGGSGLNGVQFVQHQIGDGSAVSNSWTLDRLITPVIKHQATTA